MSNDFKLTKFDFYDVERPKNFTTVLKKVAAMSAVGEERTAVLGAERVPYRATHIEIGRDDVAIDLRRISIHEPIIKGDTQGNEEIEELEDDEGPVRDTSGLWIERYGILLLERTRTSCKTFVEYFYDRADLPYGKEPTRVSIGDPMELAEALEEVRKLVIQLSGDSAMKSLDGVGLNVTGFLAQAANRSDVSIRLEVRVARGGRGFPKEGGLRWFKKSKAVASPTTLMIGGRNAEKKTQMLNLLDANMFEEVNVPRTDRIATFPSRLAALREAYERRRVEVSNRRVEVST